MRKWYFPLALLLVIAFAPWLKEFSRVNEADQQALLAIAPKYDMDTIQKEFNWVKSMEREWSINSPREEVRLPESPKAYWEYLDRLSRLEDALKAILADTAHPQRPEVGARLRLLSMASPVMLVQSQFEQKFGADTMLASRPKGAYFVKRHSLPHIENRLLEFFSSGYIMSIPVMLLVFIIRLRVRELLVWPELPRLLLAAIGWPLGLVLYPKNVVRTEQLKSAMSFAAQLASAAVSLFGFGAAMPMAKAQSLGKTDASKQSSSKQGGSHTFGYGLEVYPQTAGIDSGLLVSPWYAHSHALSRGFSLSGFGFVEMGERKGQLFINHALNVSHAKAYGSMLTVEAGGTATSAFLQVGPRVNLVKVPGFRESSGTILKSLVAGSLWRVRGPTHYQEWFLGWGSKEASLPLGWKISSEGFMRFRPGGTHVGQPQILLRHPRIPHTQFVTEFWMIGAKPTIRLGVQFAR